MCNTQTSHMSRTNLRMCTTQTSHMSRTTLRTCTTQTSHMSRTTLRTCTTQTSHMSRTTLHMCNIKHNATATQHLAGTLEHDLGPRPPTQLSITVQQHGREPGNILQVSHIGREEIEGVQLFVAAVEQPRTEKLPCGCSRTERRD